MKFRYGGLVLGKAIRMLEIFGLSRYFGLFGLSDFETSPVQDPWFQMSKNFAKLTKNLTKNKVRNPCPKIIKNSENSSLNSFFLLFPVNFDYSHIWPSFCQNTKSHLSRPLSALGQLWVCFWHVCNLKVSVYIYATFVLNVTSVIYATSVLNATSFIYATSVIYATGQ